MTAIFQKHIYWLECVVEGRVMLQNLNILASRKVHAHVNTTINILSEWDDAKVENCYMQLCLSKQRREPAHRM